MPKRAICELETAVNWRITQVIKIQTVVNENNYQILIGIHLI